MRRYSALIALAALLLVIHVAYADNTAAALKEFGLVGRWTFDCKYDDGEVFEVPFLFGSPTFKQILITGREHTIRNNVIKSATRLTNEKIKFVSSLTGGTQTYDGVTKDLLANEPDFVNIFQKFENKIMLTDRFTEDKKIIYVLGGDIYISPNYRNRQILLSAAMFRQGAASTNSGKSA
jgi:hypothetical protein